VAHTVASVNSTGAEYRDILRPSGVLALSALAVSVLAASSTELKQETAFSFGAHARMPIGISNAVPTIYTSDRYEQLPSKHPRKYEKSESEPEIPLMAGSGAGAFEVTPTLVKTKIEPH
jgi:hypothetical protein